MPQWTHLCSINRRWKVSGGATRASCLEAGAPEAVALTLVGGNEGLEILKLI